MRLYNLLQTEAIMAEWHLLRKPDGALAGVGSSDRTHDVDLYVDGDFEDDNQMRKYCE